MRVFSGLCLLLAAGLASSGSAQAPSVRPAPEVISIEGADLYTARRVIRRFFATERRPECYLVLFSRVDGNLRVEFVPRQPRVVFVSEGEPPDPNMEPRCGRNVGYVLDRHGNVIRRIYSR